MRPSGPKVAKGRRDPVIAKSRRPFDFTYTLGRTQMTKVIFQFFVPCCIQTGTIYRNGSHPSHREDLKNYFSRKKHRIERAEYTEQEKEIAQR